jgi:hypothetical protein
MMRLCAIALLTIAVLVVQGCSKRPHGTHKSHHVITVEQAKKAVRAFEGNPNLVFSSAEMRTLTEDPDIQYYELECSGTKPDDGKSWSVDPQTAEVDWASYDYSICDADKSTEKPSGPVTKSACRKAGLAYARAHFRGFDSLNMVEYSSDWEGTGWGFAWEERLANGAWGGSSVNVQVSAQTGRVQHYDCNRVPTPHPPDDPKLTPKQAIAAAAKAAGIVKVMYHTKPRMVATDEAIYFSFDIGGEDARGRGQLYEVGVNSVTGEAECREPPQAPTGPDGGVP